MKKYDNIIIIQDNWDKKYLDKFYLVTRKQDQQIKLLDQILDKVQPTLRKDCNYRYFPFWDISWDFAFSNLEKIRAEASWSEERQNWRLPDLTVQKTKLPPAGKSVQCWWQWCDKHVPQPPFGEIVCRSWTGQIVLFMPTMLIIRWGNYIKLIINVCNWGN